MCTSISYRRNDHYFGRNLDIEFSFNEKVIITPRNYLFRCYNGKEYHNKTAIIGTGIVYNNSPLYYEGTNESGLAIASLNFPGNMHFFDPVEGKNNLLLSEVIPWILSHAANLDEARKLLLDINIIPDPSGDTSFALHFMVSDKSGSVVVETTEYGLKVYDNPFDVMTNNPPFPYHLWNMNHYLNLSPRNEENRFSDKFTLQNDGVGMGAYGLPGDVSSTSRFVRAAFNLANSDNEETEEANVSQFFHVLDSVAMLKGCTYTNDGKKDITMYSCCINTDKGIYYYKTYDNSQINAIRMHEVDLDSDQLYIYDMEKKQNINYIN